MSVCKTDAFPFGEGAVIGAGPGPRTPKRLALREADIPLL